MTMNFAGMTLPSVSDVDAALHEAQALRDLLEALGPCVSNMQAVLIRREQSLRSLREELVAHAAELAARAAEQQRVGA